MQSLSALGRNNFIRDRSQLKAELFNAQFDLNSIQDMFQVDLDSNIKKVIFLNCINILIANNKLNQNDNKEEFFKSINAMIFAQFNIVDFFSNLESFSKLDKLCTHTSSAQRHGLFGALDIGDHRTGSAIKISKLIESLLATAEKSKIVNIDQLITRPTSGNIIQDFLILTSANTLLEHIDDQKYKTILNKAINSKYIPRIKETMGNILFHSKPNPTEVIKLTGVIFEIDGELSLPKNVHLIKAKVYQGKVSIEAGNISAVASGAIAIAAASGAIADADNAGAVANATVAGAKAYAIASGAVANATASGAIACTGKAGAVANATASGAEAFAIVSGATAYANVSGAEAIAGNAGAVANATAAGAEAYATVAGATAIATVSGATAKATVSGAIAEATVSGAIAKAIVSGAIAYATASEAEAYATAFGAIAFANASGARAYATTSGARAKAIAPGAIAKAIVCGAIAEANVSGARALATADGARAKANVSGAEAYATAAVAEANATASGAIAFATADGADAYATADGARADATASGALAFATASGAIARPFVANLQGANLQDAIVLLDQDNITLIENYNTLLNNNIQRNDYESSEIKELISNFIKRINNNKYLDTYTANDNKEIDIQNYPTSTIEKIVSFTITKEEFFTENNDYFSANLDKYKNDYLLNTEYNIDNIPEDLNLALWYDDQNCEKTLETFPNPEYKSISISDDDAKKIKNLAEIINNEVMEIKTVGVLIDQKNEKISKERYYNLNKSINNTNHLALYDGMLMVHDRYYDREKILELLAAIKAEDEKLFITTIAKIIAGLPTNLSEQKSAFKDTFTHLFVTGNFPSEGLKLTYYHFLLRCGQVH